MPTKIACRCVLAWSVLLVALLILSPLPPCAAQMVSGANMPGFRDTLRLGASPPTAYSAQVVESSVPGNVLWPGDQPTFTVQFVNRTGQPLQGQGRMDVIAYGTRGVPGDIWTPHVEKIADAGSVPIAVNVPPGGFQDVTVSPRLPARFGGYALVADLGPLGRQFVTSCVRTFAARGGRIPYPHFCLDALPVDVLRRLDVHAIRYGESYKPTTDADFARWYAEEGKRLKAYQDAGIAVLFMVGGGAFFHPDQPLGRPRPWLDAQGVMQDTKFDLAWLPSYDVDFQRWCYQFARDYGWPRGPINAFSLWNEPWEGISISGWGADMLRYRAMYTHMFGGVAQARRAAGAQVLVGGCDSSSNAFDKLFSDGTQTFLPMFDFLSIHYQGLDSMATVKSWVDRKGYGGRVRIWDTESWVANTDDRVAAVVAGDRAAGYDRAMGVFGGNIADPQDQDQRLPDGKTRRITTVTTWSTAAAVGAATHFIGERPFRRLLFQNGLPWVMLFGGLSGHADDGTAVVVGDLGEEFGGDQLPFRTARGFAELRHKAALTRQLDALPADAPAEARAALQTQLDVPETLSGATMTLAARPGVTLYDFYGNPVPPRNGKVVVPLDGRGFFLRGDGRPGSFARLVQSLQAAHVEGIEPLAAVAHDMTAPIDRHPALRLSLTNVLPRPVQGTLHVTLGALAVRAPALLRFAPNETREITVKVVGGHAVASNTYPFSLTFDAGRDGRVVHQEDMHCNVIARRTITVDGDLSDWKGVLPQTIVASGTGAPTLTEQAWLPFQNFSSAAKSGLATAYLAYDAKNFYFAAKVADATPDPGMVRFGTRDDDAYFYPEKSYVVRLNKPGIAPVLGSDTATPQELDWPAGVRRYSYRKDPDLPAGDGPNHDDNIQIAFNVLSPAEKPWYPHPPGVMFGFTHYKDTDYEYALNPVAAQYGGGTEIWRLDAPGMPHKHFYPRQPKSPFDGPVQNGSLVIRRDGNTRIVECALPWTELPEVKKRLDAGQPIKFSYRVNDNAGGPTMELSKGRSVAKRNGSFHVDWVEHWANELEFGWGKP